MFELLLIFTEIARKEYDSIERIEEYYLSMFRFNKIGDDEK